MFRTGITRLYLLNGSDGWHLIVSRETSQWGTDYDASRISAGPRSRTALSPIRWTASPFIWSRSWLPGRTGATSLHGTLIVMWGSSALSTDWQVEGAGIGTS